MNYIIFGTLLFLVLILATTIDVEASPKHKNDTIPFIQYQDGPKQLQDLQKQINELKAEMENIKRIAREHGIKI